MKKNILFVIDSLHCAGAEKSLITLLSLIDYKKYKVDLQLFGYGGQLEEVLPKEVNLLTPISYMKYNEQSIKDSIINCRNIQQAKFIYARLKYSLNIRLKKYTNAQMARIFWRINNKLIEKNPKKYDIAISYAQGIPTFYVADKIKADKKIAWVNTSYKLNEKDKNYQMKFYDKYNKIIAVSHSAREILIETFPKYSKKTDIIYDINDYNLIYKMSKIGQSYNDNFDGIRVLTIGRLDYGKRYDRAIEACKILKDKGINFKWYALGIGGLQDEINNLIKSYNLENEFILLGVKSNPYPYIKDADIYVQTSDFEGFGLAIAEARILNIPVVTTEFDSVYNQMIQEKNGLIVGMNAQAVVDGIVRLIENKELRESIINYLKQEKKGNIEELEKFYNLIES